MIAETIGGWSEVAVENITAIGRYLSHRWDRNQRKQSTISSKDCPSPYGGEMLLCGYQEPTQDNLKLN
jgi:hypothetical protein